MYTTALAILCSILAAQPLHTTSDSPQWKPVPSPSKASLRGVHTVDASVAWASGSSGTCLRTVDGGRTWQAVAVPNSEQADFRDVHAFDQDHALLMAVTKPARILRTINAGETWDEVYVAESADMFLDAMSFSDQRHGVVFGDPIDGHFTFLSTTDGGHSWQALNTLPPALQQEFGFAASGTCATTQQQHIWIGTGGTQSRVLHSSNRGHSWHSAPTPLAKGSSAGVFSIAFVDQYSGVAVGGDYEKDQLAAGNCAISTDGGLTWRAITDRPPGGYRSCVAFVPQSNPRMVVAVGSSGSDYSVDDGKSWSSMGSTGYHAVSFAPDGTGWAVGTDGRMARWVPSKKQVTNGR